MNTTTVVGNVTRDPELRYTPSGNAVVKVGIAVNRFYTGRNGEKVEHTDFLTVVAWRGLAENVAESIHTGDRIAVSGRLQVRSWDAEDGAKRSTVEIEAEDIAASMRFAKVQITKAPKSNSGANDWNAEADQVPEEVPVG